MHVSLNIALAIGRSIIVQLTSCLTGLDLAKQVKLMIIQQSQAAESKQNKQEVSRSTEILPLKLVFSGQSYGYLHTLSSQL